jgi:hypothetical protein
MPVDVLDRFLIQFPISREWLIEGKGEMFLEKSEAQSTPAPRDDDPASRVYLTATELLQMWRDEKKERSELIVIIKQLADDIKIKNEMLKKAKVA